MKACVVGYGAIGPVHAEALEAIKNADLYAICDIIKERADEGAEKYNAKAYYSYDDCLNDKEIECVHICTPHYLHFEMVTKALEAGKRVVVEKPAVMKKEQLDILFEKYDVTKIFPIVQNRSNTCIKKLKELVSSEEYGKLKGVKGIVTWNRDASYYNQAEWRGTKDYEGGGVLINQSVHTFDLMVYFAGEVASLEAVMQNNSLKGVIEVEDTASAYINFKNGAKGIFYATNAYTANSSVMFELDFENKNFLYHNGTLVTDGEIVCKDSMEYSGKSYWGSGHANVLHDLYVNNSKFCLNDVKETMYAMFAMYDSANNRKEIIL